MVRIYKIVRALVVAILIFLVGVPVGLYVVMSTPWAQDKMRSIAAEQLAKLLGTDVHIGGVSLKPFDSVVLTDIAVDDDFDKKALTIEKLTARFELKYFFHTGNLAFDYVTIDRLNVSLYKASADKPLNIAGIIEHLKPKDKNKPPTKFKFNISDIEINNASFAFDILDRPQKAHGFDANHIRVSDLKLFASLPAITNEGVSINLVHLSLKEHSGLRIDNFTMDATVMPNNVSISNPELALPNSLLRLNDFDFAPEKLADMAAVGRSQPAVIEILKGSFVTLSDLSWIAPAFANVNRRFDLEVKAGGVLDDMSIEKLFISETGARMYVDASGHISSLSKRDSLTINNLDIKLASSGGDIADLVSRFSPSLPRQVTGIISRAGNVDMKAFVSGTLRNIDGTVDLRTSLGNVFFDGMAEVADNKRVSADAAVNIQNLDLGTLLANTDFGVVNADIDATGVFAGYFMQGHANVAVDNFSYKNVDYHDIAIEANVDPAKNFTVSATADHEFGRALVDASGCFAADSRSLSLQANFNDVNLHALNLISKYQGYRLSADVSADLSGDPQEWINGFVSLKNLRFTAPDSEQQSLALNNFTITADDTSRPSSIQIAGDIINGSIEGDICMVDLVTDIRAMLSQIVPALVPAPDSGSSHTHCHGRFNDFTYTFTLDNLQPLSQFLRFPAEIIYPVSIDGVMNAPQERFTLGIDAPYLLQGEKIIENTALQVDIRGTDSDNATIYATTQMPTKKGTMALVASMAASANRVDSRVDWHLEREKPINGRFSLSSLLGRDENDRLTVDVDFNPCDINFGNDTWHISPSQIFYRNRNITVKNFVMTAGTQRIAVNGRAAEDSDSHLHVDLKNIYLATIFETLDIDKALIGGYATGTVDASALFSDAPVLTSDNLHVDSISYNYCVLGNAEVKAFWDNSKKSVNLDADITNPQGQLSRIYGSITPAKEELDINIDADNVRVGFMKPFMSAFADDIKGLASGHAHLFGTFKYIDLEGDIMAKNLGLKVGFTNTWYYCTDSVHIRPGIINIDNVTVRDAFGNTALLNGFVKHEFFKRPVFDFAVTEAENFLSYDTGPKQSPDWYGRIFGNGSAFINGRPGVVNIDVNMSTAPGSTFTFVLSDMEEAEEYKFITFRDRNAGIITDSIIEVDHVPPIVRQIQQRAAQINADKPSDYNMNFQIDITPQARIIIVMDPVGGDQIKANGAGNLRMTYNSPSNDLRMYGTYTIEQGSYNFTLQDIIVKDFKIKEGSSIAFTGDPYAGRLDIEAIYSVSANLSDLDESFLQDKELNRTNVPVHALLKVNGDMRQPDISFDLEFPTLTSDTYRKVRSIVSTDEMMNRQIIYLLALGRFYTPEYMSTTKGNELFSVASSTIGSQLSSMLGKLSENWSINPTLRSDKGDFSDVAFDLALSSSLLNNRLRFNGNFGYRDKSLNTNQFIGDFDIEYLINRSGSWRLKTYNRFNDQNYYLRTAQTTQGIGIMYRKDFDKMFNFLRPAKKKNAPADSIQSRPGPESTHLPDASASTTDSISGR